MNINNMRSHFEPWYTSVVPHWRNYACWSDEFQTYTVDVQKAAESNLSEDMIMLIVGALMSAWMAWMKQEERVDEVYLALLGKGELLVQAHSIYQMQVLEGKVDLLGDETDVVAHSTIKQALELGFDLRHIVNKKREDRCKCKF